MNRRSPDRYRSFLSNADSRALSPVIGVILLVALTLCLGAVVVLGFGTWSLESTGPTAAFELSVDGNASVIVVEHRGGESVDVERLSVRIAVNGRELTHQPPVPFVGARGFDGAPSGPFNAATDSEWRAGERASLTVAGTNTPEIEPDDSVTVSLVVDRNRVAILEATAT